MELRKNKYNAETFLNEELGVYNKALSFNLDDDLI